MTDAASPPSKPRRRRWITIALIVSICLNILIIGAVAGFMFKHQGYGLEVGNPGALKRIMWRLDEPLREQARALIAERRPEFRRLGAALHDARVARARAIGADPLDPAAVSAATAEVARLHGARREMVDAVFVEILSWMPAEDREALAKRLRAHHHKRKHGRDRGKSDG